MKKKKLTKKMLGPVITIIILTIVVTLLSAAFSLIEIDAEKTVIIRGTLETSIITVNNILTKDGISYILKNVLTNLQIFEPLFLLIISLTAIGIGEASGLFKAIFQPFKRINNKFLTLIILLIGIISSFIGDYSYVFLMPLTAILYQYMGKKPLLGILTIFLGITIGYGTGIIYNNEGIVLSTLTTNAASLDVDKGFSFVLKSNIYIMFVSTAILAFVGTHIIHSLLDKKIPKSEIIDDDLIVSKKGLYYSNLTFLFIILGLIYMITPGIKGSGFLLGSGESYIERLMGENSPFANGLPFIVLTILMICSYVYGYISGNIKNSTEYSLGLSKNFKSLGYVFVLLFFTAQLVGIFEWTNLGKVIGYKLVTLTTVVPFSGIILLLFVFAIFILMSLFIPSSIEKWEMASPLIIPLMMKSNITPNFTQFLFRAADGIGKCLTPLFPYYIITLAFLEKYNTKDNNKITVFGTLKLLFPTILMFALLWLIIIVGWFILGLPIGPETYATY